MLLELMRAPVPVSLLQIKRCYPTSSPGAALRIARALHLGSVMHAALVPINEIDKKQEK